MASKGKVWLTSQQVLEAIMDSNGESESELDESESDDSVCDDFIDENGNGMDFAPQPPVNIRYVPDPCDRDSLLIGNVSNFFPILQ